MRFVNLQNNFLRTTCLVVLLSVPALVWAQKNKNSGSSSPPPSKPAAAPAQQRSAPNVNRPSQPATGQRPVTTTGKGGPGTTGKGGPGTTGKGGPGTIVKPTVTTTSFKGRDGKPGTVTFRGDRPAVIQKGNVTITHGLGGSVHVEKNLGGNRKVVSTGRGTGYLQRPYANRFGHAYSVRHFYDGRRHYAYAYREYRWGGRIYYRYAPPLYYRPGYYGWVYNPWAAPVYYQWGWAGNPWYGYYGYYFAPEPFYPGANLWLTDFLLAENLRMAYDERQNASGEEGVPPVRAAATSPNDVQLSPEVKQMIAEEVKQQLAAEKAAALRPSTAESQPTSGDELPPALDPSHTVFVVASSLDVTKPDGTECELTAGDVLSRLDDTPDKDDKVQVRVTSSKEKKNECKTGSKQAVLVTDLQEMQNQFHERLDAGLKQLANNQGKNGLPAAPNASTLPGEVGAPESDPTVVAELGKLQMETDQDEQDAKQHSSSGQTGGGK